MRVGLLYGRCHHVWGAPVFRGFVCVCVCLGVGALCVLCLGGAAAPPQPLRDFLTAVAAICRDSWTAARGGPLFLFVEMFFGNYAWGSRGLFLFQSCQWAGVLFLVKSRLGPRFSS